MLTMSWIQTLQELVLGVATLIVVVEHVTTDAIFQSTQSDNPNPWVKILPSEMKVVDGGKATFLCETNIDNTPYMYFRRNGRRVPQSEDYGIYRTWGGMILRIENVTMLDDAFFECIVEHEDIKLAVTDSALLRVYPKTEVPDGYPVILEHPAGLRLIEEDGWTIIWCSASGIPKPTVHWIKDYAPLDMTSHRLNIIDNGSLQIAYTHDYDSGVYECIASNELGVAYSDSGRLFVEEYTWPD